MNLNISKFQKILKIKIKNKTLLIEALTHKSANQEINNEKLEFLGDRVIALILSKSYLIFTQKNPKVLQIKSLQNWLTEKLVLQLRGQLDLKISYKWAIQKK